MATAHLPSRNPRVTPPLTERQRFCPAISSRHRRARSTPGQHGHRWGSRRIRCGRASVVQRAAELRLRTGPGGVLRVRPDGAGGVERHGRTARAAARVAREAGAAEVGGTGALCRRARCGAAGPRRSSTISCSRKIGTPSSISALLARVVARVATLASHRRTSSSRFAPMNWRRTVGMAGSYRGHNGRAVLNSTRRQATIRPLRASSLPA